MNKHCNLQSAMWEFLILALTFLVLDPTHVNILFVYESKILSVLSAPSVSSNPRCKYFKDLAPTKKMEEPT